MIFFAIYPFHEEKWISWIEGWDTLKRKMLHTNMYSTHAYYMYTPNYFIPRHLRSERTTESIRRRGKNVQTSRIYKIDRVSYNQQRSEEEEEEEEEGV